MSNIHQEVQFAAAPQRIYAALTDSAQFAALTEAPAEIGHGEGAAFSCFGGMITGRNVEMIPGQRLVQAWRAGTWEPGIYSIVRFELAADGAGTRLVFDQAGFPTDMAEHLEGGWKKMYWDKLAAIQPRQA
jgi:uncharacterized protein YndB with AHSA1/START domain